MTRHVGVAAVDHRIEVTCLDHRDLCIVGNHKMGHAAEEGEGAIVRFNPVRKLLGPRRAGKPSGIRLTKESDLGFPFGGVCASLPDAHRNLAHRFFD